MSTSGIGLKGSVVESSTGRKPVEDSKEAFSDKDPSIKDKRNFLLALKGVIDDWKQGLYQVRGFSSSENRGVVLSPCERKITNYKDIQDLAESGEAVKFLLNCFENAFRIVVPAIEAIHRYAMLDSTGVCLGKIQAQFNRAAANLSPLRIQLKVCNDCRAKKSKLITNVVLPYFYGMIDFTEDSLSVYKDVIESEIASFNRKEK